MNKSLLQKPRELERKEIIKIRVKLSETKAIEKNNKTYIWLFEKVSKLEKPLLRMTKEKRVA